MSYSVIISSAAQKDLKGLPKKIEAQVTNRIDGLESDAYPPNSLKIKGDENLRRIRSGTYRILYEIDERKKAIEVLRILHRKDAYRNL